MRIPLHAKKYPPHSLPIAGNSPMEWMVSRRLSLLWIQLLLRVPRCIICLPGRLTMRFVQAIFDPLTEAGRFDEVCEFEGETGVELS